MNHLPQETPVTESEDYGRSPGDNSPEVVKKRAGTSVRVCDALREFDRAARTNPGMNFGDFVADKGINLY